MAAPKVAIPVLRQTGKGIKAKEPAVARFIFTGKVEDAVPLMHAKFQIVDCHRASTSNERPHSLPGRETRDVEILFGEPVKQRAAIYSVDPLAVAHVASVVHDESMDE
jgi:hypothetical protein